MGLIMENAEYAKMMSKMIKAFGRRAANGNPNDLALLVIAQEELTRATQLAVNGLIAQGFSWSEIAKPLGCTRQNAWKKWGSI